MKKRAGLLESNILSFFIAERAEQFAAAIGDKSRCMANFVAIFDGTLIEIARSRESDILLRVAYNEYKRNHALNYQAVITPDGICIHLHGPEVGRRHEMFLYASSRMDEILTSILTINGKQFVVFGESEIA